HPFCICDYIAILIKQGISMLIIVVMDMSFFHTFFNKSVHFLRIGTCNLSKQIKSYFIKSFFFFAFINSVVNTSLKDIKQMPEIFPFFFVDGSGLSYI